MNRRTYYLQFIPCIALVFYFLFLAAAFAANPIPQVVGPPKPQAVVPGSGAFTLTVYGANFVSGAVVNWNRSARSTAFVSARELQAQILASDVAQATAGYITVTNPAPGGGVSSSSFAIVEVHTPTTTIVPKRPTEYLKQGGTPFFLIPADFNNDGILDFAVSDGKEDIEARLGNRNGTFSFGSFATRNYNSGSAIAYGDFNSDGNEDLVFGADPLGPPTELQVSLGLGDGKFRKGSHFAHFAGSPLQIVVGDFNGDGSLDAIALEQNVTVFLGNGDGTFKHLVDYFPVGFAMVTADFNGDGILDLVLSGEKGNYLMLGKGDGTFQKPRKLTPVSNLIDCASGQPILVSDFNGDGQADLAYCESDQKSGKIWIMLGNGDGTFKKPVLVPINTTFGFSIAAGDFNSDGKTDLLANFLVSYTESETDLFLGNGDGTFQSKKVVNLPGSAMFNAEEGIVSADFNSDGLLDFIFQEPGEVTVFVQK